MPFAYREVPPAFLLYGRKVRGPLDVLKEPIGCAQGGEVEGQGVIASQVLNMREKLQEMMGLVQVNVEKAQKWQKRLYDHRCRRPSVRSSTSLFEVGMDWTY